MPATNIFYYFTNLFNVKEVFDWRFRVLWLNISGIWKSLIRMQGFGGDPTPWPHCFVIEGFIVRIVAGFSPGVVISRTDDALLAKFPSVICSFFMVPGVPSTLRCEWRLPFIDNELCWSLIIPYIWSFHELLGEEEDKIMITTRWKKSAINHQLKRVLTKK